MSVLGLPSKILSTIEALYSNTLSCVRVNENNGVCAVSGARQVGKRHEVLE